MKKIFPYLLALAVISILLTNCEKEDLTNSNAEHDHSKEKFHS